MGTITNIRCDVLAHTVKARKINPLCQLGAVLLFVILAGCKPNNLPVVLDTSRDRSIAYDILSPEDNKQRHPLILLSHGSGGEIDNHRWLMKALVNKGYIVAAVNHPGDTTMDNTSAGVVRVWDRPLDLSFLLDQLLADPQWQNRIDTEKIGAAGFSSGGYTVLALGGARYEASQLAEYCQQSDHGPDCDLADPNTTINFEGSSDAFNDHRVKAIFAMAPAVGPAITKESLIQLSVPVHIIAAQDDELVLLRFSAQRYAAHIPDAELVLLPAGGHFIFLECNAGTRVADWFIDNLDLCGTAFDVDRTAIRAQVADKAIHFFNTQLLL